MRKTHFIGSIAPPTIEHIVKYGETLGTIAQKYLGSSSRWKEIWDLNPQITNPDLIKVGDIIYVIETYGPFLEPNTSTTTNYPTTSATSTNTNVQSSFDFSKILSEPKTLVALAGGSLLLVYLLTRPNKTTSSS